MSNDPYAAPSANLDNTGSAAVIPTSYWNAKGRLSVLSYLAHSLLLVLVFTVVIAIVAGIVGMLGGAVAGMPSSLETIDFSNPLYIAAAVIIIPLYILMLYMTVCMMIKRLHDRNHSGWWCLALFVALMIPLVNIVGIVAMIYVVFFPGNKTGNRFGGRRPTKGWEKVLGILYLVLIIGGIVAAMVGGAALFMGTTG